MSMIGKSLAHFVILCSMANVAFAAGPDVEHKLQTVLDDFDASNPTIPGVMVAVDSERLGLHWRGAAGFSKRESIEAITPNQPLRLASITKTYVAAAVLRLMEQNKLGLDDALGQHLPRRQQSILRKGGYDPRKITIRHLLTHTSGIQDYAMSDQYFEAATSDPHRHWTRNEQLQIAMDIGAPIGLPGEYYHYSDTGYILLGEIIERRSGMGLAKALRKLLHFDTLGLSATWMETLEPRPDSASLRAHQYWGKKDTTDWHASFDLYGGGGLVANMPDLALFFRALFQGEIFESPKTLQTMLTTTIPDYGGPFHEEAGIGVCQYCMGIFATRYRDYTVFLHGGFWGTRGVYIPSLGLSMGMAVTQQESGEQQKTLFESLLDVVIDTVESR